MKLGWRREVARKEKFSYLELPGQMGKSEDQGVCRQLSSTAVVGLHR